MPRRFALALAVFVPFTAFTIWVAVEDGPLGFLTLAREGGWGLQMVIDLLVYIGLASLWMVPDARRHGINPWPFVVASLGLASIGTLAYLIYRELHCSRRTQMSQRGEEPVRC